MINDKDKLPKWAQMEMTRLEGAASYYENRLRESMGEFGDGTDTEIYMGYQKASVGLPKGSPVRFMTEHGQVEARVADGRLEISTPHGGIVLLPRVTNVVVVDVIPR